MGINQTITVSSRFSAAHRVYGYPETVHGHNFEVEVEVSSAFLDHHGFVFDFIKLQKILETILIGLDHAHLNSLPHFWLISPTAENILYLIAEKVEAMLEAKSVTLTRISLKEEEGCTANWYRDVADKGIKRL